MPPGTLKLTKTFCTCLRVCRDVLGLISLHIWKLSPRLWHMYMCARCKLACATYCKGTFSLRNFIEDTTVCHCLQESATSANMQWGLSGESADLCSSTNMLRRSVSRAQVFACTVGQKPSKAPFYLNDTSEVAYLLSRLADLGAPPPLPPSLMPLAQRPRRMQVDASS